MVSGMTDYVFDLSRTIESKLLLNIAPGEIRRHRLRRGLALAYVESDHGLLTLSRVGGPGPSDEEVKIVRCGFMDACRRLNRPVLQMKETERMIVHLARSSHSVVRFSVLFGKQERLL